MSCAAELKMHVPMVLLAEFDNMLSRYQHMVDAPLTSVPSGQVGRGHKAHGQS